METNPTPTTRFERIKAFVIANPMLLFALFLFVAASIMYISEVSANATLSSENRLMRELLKPDCPGDSTGR